MTAVSSMNSRQKKSAASSDPHRSHDRFCRLRRRLTEVAVAAAAVGDIRTILGAEDLITTAELRIRPSRAASGMGTERGIFRTRRNKLNISCMTSFISKYKSSKHRNMSCACSFRTRPF